jgi:SAM-dependent methyltransferase
MFAGLVNYHDIDYSNYGVIKRRISMKFPLSALALKYCVGSGLEIGGSAHNPFGLNTKNVDVTDDLFTVYKLAEIHACGEALPVDIVASGDKLPVEDQSVDFVVSSHVLEHFYDPIEALLEWYRVIRVGGIIFMIIPHMARTFDRVKLPTTLAATLWRHQHKPIDIPAEEDDHHNVWTTAIFMGLIYQMNETIFPSPMEVVEVQDVDDKVGNGFTVVLRRLK